jgi:hypothetical protein
MLLTSSSAIDTDTTGMAAAVSPADLYSLKKATLLSPLSVLKTALAPDDLTLLTIVENSVEPSGA